LLLPILLLGFIEIVAAPAARHLWWCCCCSAASGGWAVARRSTTAGWLTCSFSIAASWSLTLRSLKVSMPSSCSHKQQHVSMQQTVLSTEAEAAVHV
jgi:hypothetical protein